MGEFAILNTVVRIGLTEKVMFAQRLEGPEENSFVNIQEMLRERETIGLWGESMQGIFK